MTDAFYFSIPGQKVKEEMNSSGRLSDVSELNKKYQPLMQLLLKIIFHKQICLYETEQTVNSLIWFSSSELTHSVMTENQHGTDPRMIHDEDMGVKSLMTVRLLTKACNVCFNWWAIISRV